MIKLIRRTVKDPAVAEQLIPDYPVFCKRTPIVDDYCTYSAPHAQANRSSLFSTLLRHGLLEFVILARVLCATSLVYTPVDLLCS